MYKPVSESSDCKDCLHYHSSCPFHISITEAALSCRDSALYLKFLRHDQVLNHGGWQFIRWELDKKCYFIAIFLSQAKIKNDYVRIEFVLFLFCFFILLFFFSVDNVNITKRQYLIITRHLRYNNKDILLSR